MTSRPSTDHVVHATVHGSLPDRTGGASQNAVAVRDDQRIGATIVAIARADGRIRRSRSHIGARIAADIAATKAEAAVAALPSADAVTLAPLGDVLAARIAEQWHAQVREHIAAQAAIASDEVADAISSYGTALLLVIVTPAAVLALQLGDGDIVLRSDDGQALRPVADDGASDSNETASLALADAQARFRHASVDRTVRDFALVLVAAGLDAASADAGWDTSFTAEVIAQADEQGIDAVDRQLPDRISATEHGDGDDVTVALVFTAAAGAPAAVPVTDQTDPRLAATMAQPAVAAAAATSAVPVTATSALPAVRAATNHRRPRRWIMAAATAGIVVLAVAAVFALSRDNGSTAPDTTVTSTPAATNPSTTAGTSRSTGSGPSTVASTSTPPSTAAPTSAPSTAPPATTVPVVVTVPTTTPPPRTTTPTHPPATTTPTTPPRTTAPPTTSSSPTT